MSRVRPTGYGSFVAIQGTRSLDVVIDEVRETTDAQLRHFDALDAKAGIVLGFAGALVALAPSKPSTLLTVGRSAAVASGLLSLWSFWPRTISRIE